MAGRDWSANESAARIDAPCFDPNNNERLRTGDVEFQARSQQQDRGNGAQAVESERLKPGILRLGVSGSGFEGVANQNQFLNY